MYKGYIEVHPSSEEEYASVYERPTENIFGCLRNQYVIVVGDDGAAVDKLRWDGTEYRHLSYKQIINDFTEKVKPRNIHQELAFDMLQNKDETLKVLLGGFGSGKTMLMVMTALQLIKDNKFEKIVWVRNNIDVKDTKSLGALPGTSGEKLLPYAMPLSDHCGGLDGLEYLQRQGKIEIVHLGFMRGRDIKNSIIICSEAENLTKQHVQLLIGRVGEGSALWLEGDLKQVDMKVFEENSGLSTAIKKLKGHELFGYVHLEKSERSATAALADLLD